MLALLALASFEAVQPLPQAARELAETLAAGQRLLELTDREPAVVDPDDPLPLPPAPFAVALEGVSARYAPGERARARRRRPPPRARPSGRARRAERRRQDDGRRTCSSASSTPRPAASRSAGATCASTARRTSAARSPSRARTRTSSRRRSARTSASGAPTRPMTRSRTRSGGRGSWTGCVRFPHGWDTLVGEEGRELSGGQRQRLVVARALLADAPVLVLDEPTAHLDPDTAEPLIHDVLDAAGSRSVLLITHRPEGLELGWTRSSRWAQIARLIGRPSVGLPRPRETGMPAARNRTTSNPNRANALRTSVPPEKLLDIAPHQDAQDRGHARGRADDGLPAEGGGVTRILVVDDEPQLLRALGTNLKARGHEIDLAPTGEVAMTLAARHHPDLVILDLGLPGSMGSKSSRACAAGRACRSSCSLCAKGNGTRWPRWMRVRTTARQVGAAAGGLSREGAATGDRPVKLRTL